MSAVGQLASGFAHEIKQPVQAILLGTQNCQADIKAKTADEASIIEDLAKMERLTSKITRIVSSLQAFSHADKPTVEAVNLNEAIEEVLFSGYQIYS